MTKLWVKFKTYNATQVSTEECLNVDDFLEACKKKLLFMYGQFPPGELSLSTTDGGTPLQPDDAIPAQNTAKTPLFISVAADAAQGIIYILDNKQPPSCHSKPNLPLSHSANYHSTTTFTKLLNVMDGFRLDKIFLLLPCNVCISGKATKRLHQVSNLESINPSSLELLELASLYL